MSVRNVNENTDIPVFFLPRKKKARLVTFDEAGSLRYGNVNA